MNNLKEFDVIVYHDNCIDGFAAAGIAHHYSAKRIMIPGDYSDPVDPEMCRDHNVVFVDYSPSISNLNDILKVAKNVTVIDHHVTAHKVLGDVRHPKFNFYYDVSLSGAQLAWKYFVGTIEPMLISLIGDRDLWTKKYPGTDFVNLAMRVDGYDLKNISEHMTYLIVNEIDDTIDAATWRLAKAGKKYDKVREMYVDAIVSISFNARLDDDTPVLKASCPPLLTSDVGSILATKSPSGVAWLTYETSTGTSNSLRVSATSEYDASAYASTHGGGGHVKASGWSTIVKPIDGSTSDGYHTFDELYEHRMVLFSVVSNQNKDLAWKSLLHNDGTMFDDYFIAGIKTPEGQYTYHYHIDAWDKFDVKELERAPEWDGHKPEDVTRLYSLVTN